MDKTTIVATLVLALLAWVGLERMGMGLSAAETLVVVAACAALVGLVRWGWSKRRAKS